MKDEDLLNVISVVFTRAQKGGLIELTEANTLVQTIEVVKEKLDLISKLQVEIEDLKQVKEKKELKALKQ